MLLVYLAWVSVLLLFTALLHAVHTIEIYTHGPLQRNLQQVQLRRVLILSKALCLCACFLLSAHFTAVVEEPWSGPPVPYNVSA